MSRPVGDEPQGLDLAAIAADDALLDRLAAGDVAAAAVTPDTAGRDRAQTTDALTWDGTVDEPAEITDAIIWTDEPVQRPPANPVKKGRAQGSADPAERVLALVRADIDTDLAAAADRLCRAPGVTWGLAEEADESAAPGVTWGRIARRTGARSAAALAAVVVSLGGVAAASVSAGPGNPLYPVHKLFAGADTVNEQAYAAGRVSTALDEAKKALDDHKPGLANGKLSVAQSRLTSVDAGSVKDALVARYQVLSVLVAAAMPAGATPTPDPTPTATGAATPTPTTVAPSTPSSSATGDNSPTGVPTLSVPPTSTPTETSDGKGNSGKGNSGKGNSDDNSGKGSVKGSGKGSVKSSSGHGDTSSGDSSSGDSSTGGKDGKGDTSPSGSGAGGTSTRGHGHAPDTTTTPTAAATTATTAKTDGQGSQGGQD